MTVQVRFFNIFSEKGLHLNAVEHLFILQKAIHNSFVLHSISYLIWQIERSLQDALLTNY